jgi:hypothetical protein
MHSSGALASYVMYSNLLTCFWHLKVTTLKVLIGNLNICATEKRNAISGDVERRERITWI